MCIPGSADPNHVLLWSALDESRGATSAAVVGTHARPGSSAISLVLAGATSSSRLDPQQRLICWEDSALGMPRNRKLSHVLRRGMRYAASCHSRFQIRCGSALRGETHLWKYSARLFARASCFGMLPTAAAQARGCRLLQPPADAVQRGTEVLCSWCTTTLHCCGCSERP